MWWQQVPSLVITYGLMCLPAIPGCISTYFFYNDKWMPRDSSSKADRKMAERDQYLMGTRYRCTGLDDIPEVD